ncbi:MAG TPA: hypothetical protein VH309_10625, partial [Elusimicrobiota bacterium]|nr:hypothetical protein [Elusimicrobiota bacterium]
MVNRLSFRNALACGLLLLSIAVPPSARADFRPLFRRSGDISNAVGDDNIRDCTPHVRRAIKLAAKKWGGFHFQCVNGVVLDVFVAPVSRINKEPASFITNNLGLFDDPSHRGSYSSP